ncbi:unnamed protein product [Chironomus riparius]|uniref:Mitochondrial import receptor subunit TOM22 homolog n=1 Tax=Chironomus riparius TaxID=315576 RepID=A0A9N9RNQ7_9DIPT|nr:unnamed protein product [Chironomus riparius]
MSGNNQGSGDNSETNDDQNFRQFITQINAHSTEFNEFDEPDESIFERISALKEMFPEILVDNVGSVISTAFDIVCEATWILFSSGIILLGPIIFEHERMRLTESLNDDDEEQKSEK